MIIHSSMLENNPSEYLSEDLFFEISFSLSPLDLCITRCVNKLWSSHSDNEEVWQYHSKLKWPDYTKISGLTWKQHYQANYNGSYAGSFNVCDTYILTTQNHAIRYFNVTDNTSVVKETSHVGSINQVIIYAYPNFAIKYLTCASDGYLKMWDFVKVHAECLHSQQIHNRAVLCMENLKNIICTGSADCSVKIWKIDGHPNIPKIPFSIQLINELTGHKHAVTCLQIAREYPYNLIFSGSRDHTIRVWEMIWLKNQDKKDCVLNQILKGHTGPITALKLHGRANCLISGSLDKTIRIWKRKENKTFECVQVIKKQIDTITSFIVDQFDSVFYSASLDGSIVEWRYSKKNEKWFAESMNVVENSKLVALKFEKSVFGNLNGEQLYSMASDGSINRWNKPSKNTKLTFEKEII